MSGIERDDWDGGPPDTPSPVPAKEQRIPRPDWTAPADDVPVPVEGRPDWPLEPAAPDVGAPKYLVIDDPVTPPDPGVVVELTLTDEHDVGIAHGAITAVMDAMPTGDHAGFETGFDSLPADTQQAIVGELALSDREADADEYETYASDDEVEQFAATTEGAELVAEWGSSADHRLGVIQARLLRMEDAADMSAAWAWFDALPSAQAKAVLRELAQ